MHSAPTVMYDKDNNDKHQNKNNDSISEYDNNNFVASLSSSSTSIGYDRPDNWFGSQQTMKPQQSWRVKSIKESF